MSLARKILPLFFLVCLLATAAVALANDAVVQPAVVNAYPGQTITFTVTYTDYGGNWFGGSDTVYWTTEGVGSAVVAVDYPGVGGSMTFGKGILGSSQSQTASVTIPAGATPGKQFLVKTYWAAGSNSYLTVNIVNAYASTYMYEPSSSLLKLYLNGSNYDGYGHVGSNNNADRNTWQNLVSGGTAMPLLGYGYNATSGWSNTEPALVSNGNEGGNVRYTAAYNYLNGQSFTMDIVYKKISGAPNFFDNWVTNNGTISCYISGSTFTLYDNAHSANAATVTNAAFLDTTNYHIVRIQYNATTKYVQLYFDNTSVAGNTYNAGLSFGESGRDLKMFGNAPMYVKSVKVWAGAGADVTVPTPLTPDVPTPSTYYQITGNVVDNSNGNQYIGGASIKMENASTGYVWLNATSDYSGRYALSVGNTYPAGVYVFNCTKSGYSYSTLYIDYPGDLEGNMSHNFYIYPMPDGGNVSFHFTVTDESGSPVSGAGVEVDDPLHFYYTDAYGHANSGQFQPGTFTISASKSGYSSNVLTVDAFTTGVYNINLTIRPPNTMYWINGNVRNASSGEGLEADISVTDHYGRYWAGTNAGEPHVGAYLCSMNSSLEAGTYTIRASMPGYLSKSVEFTYPEDFVNNGGYLSASFDLVPIPDLTATPTVAPYVPMNKTERENQMWQMVDAMLSLGPTLMWLVLLAVLFGILDMIIPIRGGGSGRRRRR